MNLNQLRIFYYTAKIGSPGLAAKHLYITAPAVTLAIHRLEEYCEVRLFKDFGRKLALTNAGKALYEIAENIFEMEILADDCIRSFQHQKRKYIRIHSEESFGAYFLPSLISLFNKLSPNVQVLVDIMPTDQVVENTVSLNNDLGFISYPIEHKKLVIKEILEDTLVLISPPSHPFTRKNCIEPKDLVGQTLIMQKESSAIPRVIKNFVKKKNVHFSISMEVSNNEVIKRVVEGGSGIALVSREVANKEVQTGKLKAIPLSDRSIVQKYYIVYHREKYISVVLKGLLNIMEKWASNRGKIFPNRISSRLPAKSPS